MFKKSGAYSTWERELEIGSYPLLPRIMKKFWAQSEANPWALKPALGRGGILTFTPNTQSHSLPIGLESLWLISLCSLLQFRPGTMGGLGFLGPPIHLLPLILPWHPTHSPGLQSLPTLEIHPTMPSRIHDSSTGKITFSNSSLNLPFIFLL